MGEKSWLEEAKNGVTLKLHIQPKASKTAVMGLYGDPPRLKIRVAAPPVDGAANEALLLFLKKKLGVTQSALQMVRGESSKSKDVFCAGVTSAQVMSALL
jgi:uncharacterized protein (TIGR00251 family)